MNHAQTSPTAIPRPSNRARQAAPRGSESNRVEQRALLLSVFAVLADPAGSVVWGLVIDSDIVILNGVFSLLSAVSGRGQREHNSSIAGRFLFQDVVLFFA